MSDKPLLLIRVIVLKSAVSVRKWPGAVSKCSRQTALHISAVIIVHDILL